MAPKIDFKKPYATIVGHAHARYEQDGVLYTAGGDLFGTPAGTEQILKKEEIVQTDEINGAKAFLRQVLKDNALSKSALYKLADQNLQNWDAVKTAALDLQIRKFKYGTTEMWKLTEEEQE